MPKKVKWGEVSCKKHGKSDPDRSWLTSPQVRTNLGETRRERTDGGCHVCKKETNG